uniref:succinate:cytochrome c oxidoreductase subunit 4 n=1 Tax=Pseudoerythrocladia kornmannii TaxID=753682 RepID=UPI001FCE0A51|nr:succinate:cytochrome c oxidoreductase subunit 4 [Pseudoerythrocladia kornmannii]UNJ19034.1 succinate:cytochrome c oxidoreductase subunit 4 [Pseudoerythrocladia kornmannii]
MSLQQSKTFFNIYFGWIHWWSIKIYSLIIIALIILLNVELLIGLTIFFLLHNCFGFEVIFEDYIHREQSKEIFIVLLRFITIMVARQGFIFCL